MHNSIFTNIFVEFVNRYFNQKEHSFIVMNNNDHGCDPIYADNVYNMDTIFNPSFSHVTEIIRLSSQIILHSMFVFDYMVLLDGNESFARKTTWVIWGGDLYNQEPTIQKKRIVCNLAGVATLTEQDYGVVQAVFGKRIPNCKAIYPVLSNFSQIDKYKNNTGSRNAVRILVGHSRSDTLNHAKCFERIYHLGGHNIKIICPLSYGGRIAYAEKVIELGRSLFGDKFQPVTDYMSVERYLQFLSTMHVGIFGQHRQQALGNMYYMLFLGKKIFCHVDTPHYNELTKFGCHLYDLNTLGEHDINSLTHNDHVEANRKAITPILDHSLARLYWARIFSRKVN
jgi:hypothetical protein